MTMDLTALACKREKLAIGLMSGTSVDGIDSALVAICGQGSDISVELRHFATYPIDAAIRQEIFQISMPESSDVSRICQLNFVLGEIFADAANRLVREAGLRNSDIDLIGSHGQTVHHLPNSAAVGPVRTSSTLQLGEPAVIAERTAITTVSGFRTRDMAAGGQGAPLVPYLDYLLFRHPTITRAIQNIGGIGNVTYLPAGEPSTAVVAFDTGPGNMVIDALMRIATAGRESFDRDGRLAANGNVASDLLAKLMQHPYFLLPPPKSTGRELFGEQFSRELICRAATYGVQGSDLVATATAFTAESIAYHYQRLLNPIKRIDQVIVGGGGAQNSTLMQMLRERLAPAQVFTHEVLGMPSEAKEAIAFAVLANETICGRSSNIPSATGARRPVVLGSITPA